MQGPQTHAAVERRACSLGPSLFPPALCAEGRSASLLGGKGLLHLGGAQQEGLSHSTAGPQGSLGMNVVPQTRGLAEDRAFP